MSHFFNGKSYLVVVFLIFLFAHRQQLYRYAEWTVSGLLSELCRNVVNDTFSVRLAGCTTFFFFLSSADRALNEQYPVFGSGLTGGSFCWGVFSVVFLIVYRLLALLLFD